MATTNGGSAEADVVVIGAGIAGLVTTLELLDAIRTRRDTLASFYQTVFDYYSSLLDLELAAATPLLK